MTTAAAVATVRRQWAGPAALPGPLQPYGEPVARPGGRGLLDMTFARVGGYTRAVRHYHRTPLYVLQPIHLDEQRPQMAFVYLQQQGDGVLQGDRYRIRPRRRRRRRGARHDAVGDQDLPNGHRLRGAAGAPPRRPGQHP